MRRAAFSTTVCLTALAASGLVSPANAQDRPASAATEVEEIVVTATRFDSALTDAPIAATVLTPRFVEDARITTLRQIDDFVPNLSFNTLGQVGATYVTIRGIESNPFIVNRAAVYVDGIPYRRVRDQALGEVEQIEVLRGPQGTLYGANTESGLIVVRTRQPTDAFAAEVDLDAYRFDAGDGAAARVWLGGPIQPGVLSASLTASYEDADAYVRNIASSIGAEGAIREAYLQGKLRWTPSDRTVIDVVAARSQLRAPGVYEQEFLPMNRAVYDAAYGAFNGGRRAEPDRLINDAPKRTEEDESLIGASLNHAFDSMTLDLNASWRDLRADSAGTDIDLTALPAVAGATDDAETAWNFEARLSSPRGARIAWVLGVNHYREEERQVLATLVGPGGLDDYAPAPPQTAEGRDLALFGQITAPVGPGLRLTGGLRWERAERSKLQEAGVLDLGPSGQFSFPAEDLEDAYEVLLPRIALDWRPRENLLVYASAARGWVPGGFNLAAASASLVGARDYSRYGAETLWSYEIGGKLTLADSRLLLSGAVFHIEADNWQEYNVLVNAQGQAISTNLITSDAAITSHGFEIELVGRPTDRLDLAASVGWVDSSYDRYVFSATQDFTGNKVKLAPEYDLSLSATWRPWGGLFVRGEASAAGDTPLNPENAVFQDAVVLLNAQLGWETDAWTARLYVENLTDELVYTTSAYTNFAFGFDGGYYAGVGQPRVVGLQLTRRW
jgi:iron complex outermembrane receptor protein